MAGLLGFGTQAAASPKITGVQVQTSVDGRAIPIVFGTTRISPNLIWYGDFVEKDQKVGKGGLLSSGKGVSQATYRAAVAMALCEGPISAIGAVFADKSKTTLSALGLSQFLGSYSQTAWGYLTSKHPTEALNYRGIAFVAGGSYDLGNSASLPNHNFEVSGFRVGSVAGQVDADPSLVVYDLLTDPHYGVGYPASGIGDLSSYQNYCLALGLLISPAYTDQQDASSLLQEIATVTNSAWVESGGLLTLVPYGDTAATGNGKTYIPPSSPLFDLSDDDFCPQSGEDPVRLDRTALSDASNLLKREYLDRSNNYNIATVEARDQALIDAYGRRDDTSQGGHLFCLADAARLSVQLELQRKLVRNTYSFRLDQRYACLELMDLVTITDPGLALDRQWVRITDIREDDDLCFLITAEEYLAGTGAAASYAFEKNAGFNANYNAPADDSIAPIFLEPPYALAGALQVLVATAGASDNWSAANVWVSTDGESYKLAGTVRGASTMGQTSASLAWVPEAASGATVDDAGTLSVDLSVSGGELTGSSAAEALKLNTAAWVGGEIIAFANADLTGADAYDLTYLVRGAYGTPIVGHVAGEDFVELGGSTLAIPFTPDRIGQKIYVKLQSLNLYGGGAQSLSDLSPYTYTIQGTALSDDLPDVTNLRFSYVDSVLWFQWDEVQDFRPVTYEVRKGDTFDSAQFLARVAHPPVPAFGAGTYWISAYSQPAPGLVVYSDDPQSVVVDAAAISRNVVASHDEAATSWSGTLDSTIESDGSGNIRTKSGDTSGYYTIPTGHRVDVGRVVACPITVTWNLIGQYVDADFLGISDFLGLTDFLGFEATAFVEGYPEIRVSQDGATWGAWQKFSPGVISGRAFDFRLLLATVDPDRVQAYATAFEFDVDVPDRTDFYPNTATSSSGDTTITFSSAAFHGGPGGSSIPGYSLPIRDAVAGDDLIIVSISLSACTFKVMNGGSRVVRHVDASFWGY